MDQNEFNKQFELDHPLPPDPQEVIDARYSRPLTAAQKAQRREDQRIDQMIIQDQADQMKLDAQSARNSYQWRLRSMKQRGRRY